MPAFFHCKSLPMCFSRSYAKATLHVYCISNFIPSGFAYANRSALIQSTINCVLIGHDHFFSTWDSLNDMRIGRVQGQLDIPSWLCLDC